MPLVLHRKFLLNQWDVVSFFYFLLQYSGKSSFLQLLSDSDVLSTKRILFRVNKLTLKIGWCSFLIFINNCQIDFKVLVTSTQDYSLTPKRRRGNWKLRSSRVNLRNLQLGFIWKKKKKSLRISIFKSFKCWSADMKQVLTKAWKDPKKKAKI